MFSQQNVSYALFEELGVQLLKSPHWFVCPLWDWSNTMTLQLENVVSFKEELKCS